MVVLEFRSGVTSAEDAESTGRQSTSKTDENVDPAKAFVLENRRITISEVANVLEASCAAVQSS